MYKRNLYMHKIAPFIDKPVVKVITGMRRVGKSSFIRQLIPDLSPAEVLYVDKESLEFDAVKTYMDLNGYVENFFSIKPDRKYLFVDEIQEIEEWERAILSLHNRGDIDIFITGSNAHLFSSELATLLSGRYIEFPIYSLSFTEFLQFRGDAREESDREFLNYLRFGGLPGLHHFELSEEVVFQYISAIYNTILLKDIVKRHGIRNIQLMENMNRYVFDNIGNIFSAKKISDYMKSQHTNIGLPTVQNYISYLMDALLIYKVPRYDIKGKRLLEVNEKYYLGDIGMRHALIGYREADIAGILENMVFLELVRRGFCVNIGRLGEKEIDFIAVKEKEKIYLQVAYLLASPETVEREFGVLKEVPDNYPKFVLSMDTTYGDDLEGIRRLNIIDFLSDPDLLKS